MRGPLEVFAVDETMARCTGSIPYTSLIWTRRYTEPGEFSMTIPCDIYSTDWAYICCWDRPETGIIQKVEYVDDSQVWGGKDSVTVSGFFLESILNSMVFLEESPEQEKVYVPKPRRPTYRKSQNPKVYSDGVGGLYYTNASGEIVSADDGRVVNETGLTEVDYKDAFGNAFGTDVVSCNYSYYESGSGKITQVAWYGDRKTYDVVFSDDRGNTFYYDEFGRLSQAVGVVENRNETYWVSKRSWNALDSDSYGHYYEVTVKGPWQRTEALEPVTSGDSIDIVLSWARRMMGDWILYEEPEISGVQKSVDPSFQYLGDLLYATLLEAGASLRLEYIFEINAYILSVYRGTDRTQEQSGNPWAVFSDTWGTIKRYSASRDDSNYRNTCHVLYDYDKPDSFDSNGWPHAGFIYAMDDLLALPTLYGIKYTSYRGYNTEHVGDEGEPALETYLDIRDDKPSCDSDWSRDVVEIPGVSGEEREQAIEAAKKKFAPPDDAYDMRAVYEAYEASIPGRGKQHLMENYPVEVVFDSGEIDADGYLRDFDLGDKVEAESSTLGMSFTGRVIEVVESYESGKADISITISKTEA